MKEIAVKQWALFGQPFGRSLHDKGICCDRLYFKYDGRSLEQTADELDALFLEILYKIKGRYPEDTLFGLGLSGGLDSRLVLHYMLQVEMKPRLFFHGHKNYHGRPWLNRSYKSAVEICKYYHLQPPQIVEYHTSPDKEYFVRDCKEHPLYPYSLGNYHIYRSEMPFFDVTLGGFLGGELFGQDTPLNLKSMDMKTHLILGK